MHRFREKISKYFVFYWSIPGTFWTKCIYHEDVLYDFVFVLKILCSILSAVRLTEKLHLTD